MNLSSTHIRIFALSLVLMGTLGCASIDRFGAKLDMAAGRIASPGQLL